MVTWPPPLYEIRVNFRAPLPYVFQWLTDYSSQDPALEKGKYQRKVIERSRRRAVLEDLTDTKQGWEWYRTVVSLHPPDRWHAELRGNVPDWSLDYRLKAIDADRTLLTIRWHIRQRAGVRGPTHMLKAATERMMNRLWKNFASSLEREYGRESGARKRTSTR